MKNPVHEAAAKALSEAGGKGGKRKLQLQEMRLRKGHKGGYIARHQMRGEDGESEEHEYVHPGMKELVAHLQEHMGEEAEEIAAEKKGGSGEDMV